MGVIGDPVGEMVLGEHGDVAALGGCLADEVTCFGVVGLDLHGLEEYLVSVDILKLRDRWDIE